MIDSMNILIVVASKHGATRGIADAIAGELRKHGYNVNVRVPDGTVNLAGFDAAIVGSAVYMGNWLPEARAFVGRHQGQLARMPVWLFSSGPLGTDPPSLDEPRHLDVLLEQSGARGYRVFAGKLDRHELSFGERLATLLVRAPEGDSRDWVAIQDWAASIAATLAEPVAAPALAD